MSKIIRAAIAVFLFPAGEIRWDFPKFLLDRHGTPVTRFDSTAKPHSEQLLSAIRKLL